MFRSLGLALVVASSMVSAAVAADLPSRKYAPIAPTIVAPVFTWSGFYVGVNGGYGFGDSALKNVGYGFPATNGDAAWRTADDNFGGWTDKRSGSFVGGGQIGYNFQMDSVVLGLEADINYADLSVERSGANPERLYSDGTRIGERINAVSTLNWFGTVRPRIGVVVSERLMVFATGGLAYGSVQTQARYASLLDGKPYSSAFAKKSATRTGWTIGGGFEYAFTDNISLKGEYAYIDLGSKAFQGPTTAPGQAVHLFAKDELTFHVVRAGLNYRF